MPNGLTISCVPLRLARSSSLRTLLPSSLLNKQPGEGTGPTIHVDFRGNLVGRVPSRGERDVFQQAPRARASLQCLASLAICSEWAVINASVTGSAVVWKYDKLDLVSICAVRVAE